METRHRILWDLLLKAIFWNIWLKRNRRIFKHRVLTLILVILKIIYLFFSWISVAGDPQHQHILSEEVHTLRFSLDFQNVRNEDNLGAPTTWPVSSSFSSWVDLMLPHGRHNWLIVTSLSSIPLYFSPSLFLWYSTSSDSRCTCFPVVFAFLFSQFILSVVVILWFFLISSHLVFSCLVRVS